jgi:hypothetical protein
MCANGKYTAHKELRKYLNKLHTRRLQCHTCRPSYLGGCGKEDGLPLEVGNQTGQCSETLSKQNQTKQKQVTCKRAKD